MQWHLRRFTHRTDKQTNTNHCDEHPVHTRKHHRCQFFAFGKHLSIVQCPCEGVNQTNAEHETKVADAVDQKCFHIGKNRGWARVPKTNQ